MNMSDAITQTLCITAAKQAHRAGCLCAKCKTMTKVEGKKVKGKIVTKVKGNKVKYSKPASKKQFNDKVKELHERQVINLDPKKKNSVETSVPKKWEKSLKRLKKHKDIDNPYALVNYMNKKGATPHKKSVHAGGPGSGRKPEHDGPSAKTEDAQRGLNIMHRGMKSAGYKWSQSSPSATFKGAVFHEYRDKQGRATAGIREHSDGKLEHMQK